MSNDWKMNSQTMLFGVIGDPISHSKSPAMMNRAFRELQINGAYGAFHVRPEQLEAAIAGVRALGFRGLNVTIPHKAAVMPLLDELDESASLIGAVNTIVGLNGMLKGYNTDGLGYVRSLKEETGISLSGKRITVLGAGGAARGVVYALAKENPSCIRIANRTVERANELAASFAAHAELSAISYDQLPDYAEDTDIVINTTSVGMHPNSDQSPIDPYWCNDSHLISDIIYSSHNQTACRGPAKRQPGAWRFGDADLSGSSGIGILDRPACTRSSDARRG